MDSDQVTIVCERIATAAEMLRNGGLVAFPTETVYGLGADATNPDSVARIFEAKGRPAFDPLIVHVADSDAAAHQVVEFSDVARRLANAFWPGPLTLVMPKLPHIPDLVTAGLPGVGIRVPGHPMALELIRQAGCPVAAPSANRFGQISPTTAQHVLAGLSGRIDAVLDGGSCAVGIESTVLSLMTSQPVILRPGGIPQEDIEAVIGPIHRATVNPALDNAAQPAPGMLSRHYAPRTTMMTIDEGTTAVPRPDQRCGLLTYGPLPDAAGFARVEQLAESGCLRACATNLFAALRSLDAQNLDVIIARRFPARGLGIALNDRLRRAAGDWNEE